MKKILFIDRDGTLLSEPSDYQVDCLTKLKLVEGVIPALLDAKSLGYKFVMISNQDGLGSKSFPMEKFEPPQKMLLEILSSQGIDFENILICPHFEEDRCGCRKPKLNLVVDYLRDPEVDFENSYVIGDRQSDMDLAKAMKIRGIRVKDPMTGNTGMDWHEVISHIKKTERKAVVHRKTSETDIKIQLNLDNPKIIEISTGLAFFDHMLEQIARHASIGMKVNVTGDLEVDDHHTVEDTALALGEALRRVLSNKIGIGRYGFALPMDDAQTQVLVDLGGRPYFKFEGKFQREKIGDMSTEMVPHFFKSIAESAKANIHIDARGDNTHHMVECIFKGFARALKGAIKVDIGSGLPSTKGTL